MRLRTKITGGGVGLALLLVAVWLAVPPGGKPGEVLGVGLAADPKGSYGTARTNFDVAVISITNKTRSRLSVSVDYYELELRSAPRDSVPLENVTVSREQNQVGHGWRTFAPLGADTDMVSVPATAARFRVIVYYRRDAGKPRVAISRCLNKLSLWRLSTRQFGWLDARGLVDGFLPTETCTSAWLPSPLAAPEKGLNR